MSSNYILAMVIGQKGFIFALLIWVLSAIPAFSEARIYVIHEADGVIRFTSRPPPVGVNAKIFTAKAARFSTVRISGSRFGRAGGRLYPEPFQSAVTKAAANYGVNHHLVRAVIHVESAFNPRARSPKGAMGLMQLMPGTASDLGVKDAYDPQQNIDGGTRYLAALIGRFKGDLRLSLAAYNAGEETVSRYGGIPPFSETQNYVTEVLRLFRAYSNRIEKLKK
jgi:soluble lytic murein transglycosylase-like protein